MHTIKFLPTPFKHTEHGNLKAFIVIEKNHDRKMCKKPSCFSQVFLSWFFSNVHISKTTSQVSPSCFKSLAYRTFFTPHQLFFTSFIILSITTRGLRMEPWWTPLQFFCSFTINFHRCFNIFVYFGNGKDLSFHHIISSVTSLGTQSNTFSKSANTIFFPLFHISSAYATKKICIDCFSSSLPCV